MTIESMIRIINEQLSTVRSHVCAYASDKATRTAVLEDIGHLEKKLAHICDELESMIQFLWKQTLSFRTDQWSEILAFIIIDAIIMMFIATNVNGDMAPCPTSRALTQYLYF